MCGSSLINLSTIAESTNLIYNYVGILNNQKITSNLSGLVKGVSYMGCFGNIIWFICGGLISGLSWLLVGVLWCITIVGIPVGLQCFKFSELCCFPFGKEVIYGGGAGSLLLNIIWLIFSGVPLAIESVIMGIVLCITIIGIPFGLQHFKIAKLALMPFGSRIV